MSQVSTCKVTFVLNSDHFKFTPRYYNRKITFYSQTILINHNPLLVSTVKKIPLMRQPSGTFPKAIAVYNILIIRGCRWGGNFWSKILGDSVQFSDLLELLEKNWKVKDFSRVMSSSCFLCGVLNQLWKNLGWSISLWNWQWKISSYAI